MQHFDIVVIGAGPAGLTASIGLAKAGKKVAVVESGKIGGDCTHYGCVPSKALLDVAQNFSGSLPEAFEEVRKRRASIAESEDDNYLTHHGIELFHGKASFVDAHTIAVDNKEHIQAKKIIISTGTRPRYISIPGLPSSCVFTNENIFENSNDVQKLCIIGGGYIACEMAEAFARLGAYVHLVYRGERLLSQEEEEASVCIHEHLTGLGVQIHYHSQVISATKHILQLQGANNHTFSLDYEAVLLAVGREAKTESLGLANAHIDADAGGICTDLYNRTSQKHIYALGDCVHDNPKFTHWAGHEGRVCVRNILFPWIKKSAKQAILPQCLYTSLQVARFGKTYQQLQQLYGEERICEKTIYFSHNDKSKVSNDTQGFVKIIFMRLSGKILASTIVGSHAGEMIALLSLAKSKGISAYALSGHIFTYPTKSEAIKHACDAFVFDTLANRKQEIYLFYKRQRLAVFAFCFWGAIVSSFLLVKTQLGYETADIFGALYVFLSTSPYGVFLYIAFFAIRPLVFIPATLFTLLSGILFGPLGILITLVGETMSAGVAYFMASMFGKNLISPESSGYIATLKKKLTKSSFQTICFLRLAGAPFDVLNYAAGLLQVHVRGFLLGTFFGIIPGVVAFVLVGASISITDFSAILRGEMKPEVDLSLLFFGLGIFIASLIGAKIFKKYKK